MTRSASRVPDGCATANSRDQGTSGGADRPAPESKLLNRVSIFGSAPILAGEDAAAYDETFGYAMLPIAFGKFCAGEDSRQVC